MENKQGAFTVKNVLRVLALLVLIFAFCPAFLVSCSGQEVGVSTWTAVAGYGDDYVGQVVDPHPFMVVLYILPIVILAVLFVKRFAGKTVAEVILGCSVADFILWLIFRGEVKIIASENYANFKVTAWFVLDIIALILMIIFSLLVIANVLQMEANLATVFAGTETKDALNQMSNAVSQFANSVSSSMKKPDQPKQEIIGYCQKCGAPLPYGCKFCTNCGAEIPQSLIDEGEKAHQQAIEEEARRQAEEQARREEEARRQAEEQARREEEARRQATEQAKREEEVRRQAEEQAKHEEEARRQAEEQAKQEVGQQIEDTRGAEDFHQADSSDEQVKRAENASSEGIPAATTAESTGEAPKFCTNCGAPLAPDAVFCENCGAKVER